MILLIYNNIMFAFDFIIFILLLQIIFPALHIFGIILLNLIITNFKNFRDKLLYFIYLSLLFALRVFFWMYVYSVITNILRAYSSL